MRADAQLGDLRRRQWRKRHDRAPGPHRRQQAIGVRGQQNQQRPGWRLLERLEQRVLRVVAKTLGIVEDDLRGAALQTAC